MIKLTAKTGYVFATKDRSQILDNEIYLGVNDSADNYVEITDEEAETLGKEEEPETGSDIE